MSRQVAALVLVAALLAAATALAGGRALQPFSVKGTRITIDGLLREWPGRMTPLSYTLRGKVRGGDPHASAEIAYDETNLYVALRVLDRRIVRTVAAGPGEDHATLRIEFPRGRGFVRREVLIYPGKPGRLAGVVKRAGGGRVPGARVVEAPIKGGLTVEAKIPWSTFAEASRLRVGLRGAIDYTDADAPGSIRAVIGTAAASLPPLALEGEQALEQSLLQPQGLSEVPARSAYGNVAGDAMLERVAVYGHYLTIVGPHYRGGKQFYYGDLGVSGPNRVTRVQLLDLDGDGRQEIVIQKRVGDPDKYREVLEVYKVGANDTPFVAFAHEVGIVTPQGRIENKVRFLRRGGRMAIEIAQGRAEGFDPTTYHEPLSGDMPGALLPWQAVGSRTFEWNGKTFAKVGETRAAPRRSLAKAKARSARPPPPPAPRPPTADELLGRVYALYRKERHVGRAHPSFDFVTDVAGDRRNERVLVHGKDIVVFGKGFRGGTSYAFITVGVKRPKDILDVTARDLTGDGKAEIIVRAELHAKESKALGGKTVERDALFVYKVMGDQIHRIFAAETGRALGRDRIVGAIALEPTERGLAIVLRPGRAVGWTRENYPFPADTTSDGGLEPLLLPWGNGEPRRYLFNGESYAEK